MARKRRAKNELHPGVMLFKRGESVMAEWHQIEPDGDRRRKRLSLTKHLGIKTKIEAQGWAREKSAELKVANRELSSALPPRERELRANQNKPILEVIETYLDGFKGNQTDREFCNESSRFQVLRDWLASQGQRGVVLCEVFNADALIQLREYIDHRKKTKGRGAGEPLSSASKDAYRRCIIRFLRWGRGRRYFTTSSDDIEDDFPRFRPPKRNITVLSPSELGRLIQSASERDQEQLNGAPRYQVMLPTVLLLALTGMRKSEALNLRWRDVDFERGIISIRQSETFTPKGKAERQLPLADSPALVAFLTRLKESAEGFEFVLKGVDEKTPKNLGHLAWKALVKAAGIPEATVKDLRSTFATAVGRAMPSMQDRYSMAERMGHGVGTAEKYYVGLKQVERGETVEACLGIDLDEAGVAAGINSRLGIQRV